MLGQGDVEIPDKLREVFEHFDSDGSGEIDIGELDSLLEALGMTDESDRKEKLPGLMELLDKDGNGQVSLEELAAYASELGLTQAPKETSSESNDRLVLKALSMFDQIDTDGSDSIDAGELEDLLRGMGYNGYASKQSAQEIMLHLDDDGSGSISREEFTTAAETGVLEKFLRQASDNEILIDEEFQPSTQAEGDLSGRPMPATTSSTEHIPEDKRKYLWRIFSMADADGSGEIGIEELYSILQDDSLLSQNPDGSVHSRELSRDHVEAVMTQIDTDGSGQLDFDEFCVAFESMFTSSGEQQQPSILSAETRVLREENDHLRQERDELQHLLRQAQDSLIEVQSALTFQCEELQNSLSDFEKENLELKDQIELLKAKLSQVN